uniref:Zgc:158417 n=1 Tax=Sinocyclocheilus rhinocerous TaxID=307959 RepID=A0A673MH35_9TELE
MLRPEREKREKKWQFKNSQNICIDTKTRIKEEIVRSVSLCPPGPHALLLVIPVKTLSGEPEMNASEMHTRLLSERVWKHTIVLFACDDGVDELTIREHIHSAEKILEKCGRRFHVLQKSTCESPTQIHALLKKIDDLVEENRGDFFIPQAYYVLIQQKTQEASGATELRKRRGSLDSPPNCEFYSTKATAALTFRLLKH